MGSTSAKLQFLQIASSPTVFKISTRNFAHTCRSTCPTKIIINEVDICTCWPFMRPLTGQKKSRNVDSRNALAKVKFFTWLSLKTSFEVDSVKKLPTMHQNGVNQCKVPIFKNVSVPKRLNFHS